MQTQKMSLANIKGKLSRDEMKKIMAGSGNTICTCGDSMITTACSGNTWYCMQAASNYCYSMGYSTYSCN